MTGLDLATDVLVVGGGPATTWAALKTARDGADVVLAGPGHCGTGDATASAGVRYAPPKPAVREAAMASREAPGGPPTRSGEPMDLTGLLGGLRRHSGWGRGPTPGALRAAGPPPGPPGPKGTSPPLTS